MKRKPFCFFKKKSWQKGFFVMHIFFNSAAERFYITHEYNIIHIMLYFVLTDAEK